MNCHTLNNPCINLQPRVQDARETGRNLSSLKMVQKCGLVKAIEKKERKNNQATL